MGRSEAIIVFPEILNNNDCWRVELVEDNKS